MHKSSINDNKHCSLFRSKLNFNHLKFLTAGIILNLRSMKSSKSEENRGELYFHIDIRFVWCLFFFARVEDYQWISTTVRSVRKLSLHGSYLI